jgi:hypothetical protein
MVTIMDIRKMEVYEYVLIFFARCCKFFHRVLKLFYGSLCVFLKVFILFLLSLLVVTFCGLESIS